MKDTFFVPSFGNRPKNLVGRDDILQKLDISLDSVIGSRERTTLLLGQRGSGKTVLLLELAEMAQKKGYVVASPTIVSNNMTQRIIEKLVEAGKPFLHKRGKKLTGGTLSILGFGGGIELKDDPEIETSFAKQLFEICRQLNNTGHPVLILIDETQANHEQLRQLIIAYQEMIGEGIDVAIVLAGLPSAVSSILNDHVLTFLNRAIKLELPPLKKNDIIAYYRNAFLDLGISTDEKMIEEAARKSEGSPFMMQLIGHYITVSSDDSGKLSRNDFSRALISSKDDYKNDICKTTLENLSTRDIEFLTAMAEDSEPSLMSDISKRLGVTEAYVQTYKRRLIQSGVITQPRRGIIEFSVPYLREYLRERQIK